MVGPDDYMVMAPHTRPRARSHAERRDQPGFDEVLVAARQGESWAFDRLFNDLNRPVAAFALARGAEDPDGLVNEVLTQVFAGLPKFSGDENAFRGFVFHVARRRLIDEYRRRSRRPATSSAPMPEYQAPGGRLPEDMPSLNLNRTLETLNQLTDDQRDVLLLRVVCDLGLAATAAALDKPVTAIKALQRRGIATLRRKISDGTVSL